MCESEVRRKPGTVATEFTMNPVLRREFVGLLQTRKAVAIQVALAVAVAILVVVRWPSEGVGDLSGATALQVLRIFGYGLLTAVMLVLPAFSATALVREKVRGTLPLLLNSPLSIPAIYFGMLGGVLALSFVDNILNLFNVQSYYQQMLKGLIILVAVLARRRSD